jgi:hypothetical protein
MKVRITFEADKEYRAAVNAFYNEPGLATYDDMKLWFSDHGTSMDNDLFWEAPVYFGDLQSDGDTA